MSTTKERKPGKRLLVVSHSHWDRQWYCTVQQFKIALVSMLDNLLDLLHNDPQFHVFHLDGQTAIVEDYLDFRPEKKRKLAKMVRKGRIKIGPWFLQPDTYIVSGESIIRNLLKGTAIARRMGKNTPVGWLPDSFGHCAQLPQILTNFGIDSFVFSRGLGDQLEKESLEFLWEAPNRDRVVAVLQKGGYYSGGNLAYPFFWGDLRRVEPDHALALTKMEALAQESEPLTASAVIPIWNGSDHMPPEWSLSETIRQAKHRLAGYRVAQGPIESYIDAIKKHLQALPVVSGELRGCRDEPILSSVLSSRIHIKQRNYSIERQIEREAEPLSVFASLLGAKYPRRELADAWDGILKNHFHDAICGCSIDQAHREMEYFFDKAEQTAHELKRIALQTIEDTIHLPSNGDALFNLLAVNPLPQGRTDTAAWTTCVPRRSEGYFLRLHDGAALPVQILGQELTEELWIPDSAAAAELTGKLHWWQEYLRMVENRAIVEYAIEAQHDEPLLVLRLGSPTLEPDDIIRNIIQSLAHYPATTRFAIQTDFLRVKLLFPVKLPAYGYTTADLCPGESPRGKDILGFPPVQARARVLENGWLRVEVNEDGSLDLTEKESGSLFTGLNRFQDQADRGDTYDFCPIDSENDLNTVMEPKRVAIREQEQGPLRGSILAHLEFEIPEKLEAQDRNRRCGSTVPLHIDCEIRIAWNSPFVEVLTSLDNGARDHRLRAYMPVPFRIDRVYSESPFYIQDRAVDGSPNVNWAAPPPTVHPHHRWVAVTDGTAGLGILSEGLPEHSVAMADPASDRGSVLALTLLRSVGWLSRHDLTSRPGHGGPPLPTPEAQCPGPHSFRYALYPFRGDILSSRICEAAQMFDAAPCIRAIHRKEGTLPRQMSLFRLSPDCLQMTAVKQSENGRYICVRFYNPAPSAIEADLSGELRVKRVWKAAADERKIQRLRVPKGRLSVQFPVTPHEIATLLIEADPARLF